MRVCIIGLGYVGLTLAVYLASKGLKVHGVDISDTVINSLERKKAHFFEVGFDIALAKVIDKGDFTFGKDYVETSDKVIYIVTVGTPLMHDRRVSLQPIKCVCDSINKVLKEHDLVVLRSTVKVGVTREIVKKELDRSGVNYYLGFCPERTLEGAAFAELASLPQIISGIDDLSLNAARDFFRLVCLETVALDSVEEAEMVKLINNSERDLMFALANEIALLCDAKGLNACRVIDAANYQYPRSNIKKPGLVGGPCLEKDPYILTESWLESDYVPRLFKTGRAINEEVISISLNRVFDRIGKRTLAYPKKVAILGCAFKGKPPTGDMRGSLVYSVIRSVKNRYPYVKLVAHDYVADSAEIENSGVDVCASSIQVAVKGADIIILQNDHPNYQKEDWHSLQKLMNKGAIIYDFWAQLTHLDTINSIAYLCLGTLK